MESDKHLHVQDRFRAPGERLLAGVAQTLKQPVNTDTTITAHIIKKIHAGSGLLHGGSIRERLGKSAAGGDAIANEQDGDSAAGFENGEYAPDDGESDEDDEENESESDDDEAIDDVSVVEYLNGLSLEIVCYIYFSSILSLLF